MNNLTTHVKEYLASKGNKEEQKKEMEYIMTHGCQGGGVSHLIYYSDTVAFYQEHKEEINELLYEALWSSGLDVATLFKNWDKEDPLALEDNNQNTLAWFGFEETVYKIYSELYDN